MACDVQGASCANRRGAAGYNRNVKSTTPARPIRLPPAGKNNDLAVDQKKTIGLIRVPWSVAMPTPLLPSGRLAHCNKR